MRKAGLGVGIGCEVERGRLELITKRESYRLKVRSTF